MTFYELIRHRLRCITKPDQLIRVMKITMTLMTVFLLHASASLLAQKVTLESKNLSFYQVFKEIKKQTGYNIVWSSELLNEKESISVQFREIRLEEVLRNLFLNKQLSYVIKNKTIVIQHIGKKNVLPINLADTLKTISGKVTDVKGVFLPGISISVRGGGGGSTSANDGSYSIKVS